MLLTRASNGRLSEPAPDEDTLQLVLRAAQRAPDHGVLRPWRFQLIRGQARARLGAVMRQALLQRKPGADEAELSKEERKPLRAPLLIVVSARVREHPKAPALEQVLSAGCAAQNILLGLHARGYAGMWRTGAPAYDAGVKRALGLDEQDAIVAFIYAGTPAAPTPTVPRPEPKDYITEWTGPDE